jgi:diguanylate cyclase
VGRAVGEGTVEVLDWTYGLAVLRIVTDRCATGLPSQEFRPMTKILVVEDDPTVRALILKLLKAEGFDAVSGEDGRAGVQLAQIHEPDLIICDIMMPECNGYEVLQQLRQDPATARIPFIFLSAKADRTDLRQGMELGADDYLTKPFKRAELLGAITARLAKQAAITQPYIDEMKRAAQNLSQLAYRDPLTNLPNRIRFHHQLQEALRTAQRTQKTVAVLCLNLDRFKAINQNWGYSNGDQLLKMAAERMHESFGQDNLVARLNGDEFCILLTHAASQEEVALLAQRILQILTAAYDLDDHHIQLHASIGIALYPEDGTTADKLLNRADTAVRYAKSQGSNRYQFYRVEMDILVAERQLIESKLELALDNQELALYYQPQVNLITGRIIGAEALVRWERGEMSGISPAKFIPIAEETGAILPIGEWVLQTACAAAKLWQQTTHLPIRVSVNLSARQFRQQDLTNRIGTILQETGLNPDLLVLELTETSVMENVEATVLALQGIRAMGVHISIDDFGTGYSSLSYLKRFPIDTLKIDQSFIQDITTNSNDAAIAKAIIAMAQSLQLKVIAEGVETPSQSSFLRQSGCYAMQGYLFSPALNSQEFVRLLLEDRRL